MDFKRLIDRCPHVVCVSSWTIMSNRSQRFGQLVGQGAFCFPSGVGDSALLTKESVVNAQPVDLSALCFPFCVSDSAVLAKESVLNPQPFDLSALCVTLGFDFSEPCRQLPSNQPLNERAIGPQLFELGVSGAGVGRSAVCVIDVLAQSLHDDVRLRHTPRFPAIAGQPHHEGALYDM
jgi:hypothetical protein